MSLAGALPRDPLDSLIMNQVMTLGKGTTGTGANTTGPGGDLYTSQAQTGLPNDGYGSISEGMRPLDSDNDGMPDTWERANGSNPNVDDAMTKGGAGYALIEDFINWLAAPHAMSSGGTAVDVDLSAYASGFAGASPTFSVSDARDGTVVLASDAHSAHFQPKAGFSGVASFAFAVKGSDGSSYSARVFVLTAP